MKKFLTGLLFFFSLAAAAQTEKNTSNVARLPDTSYIRNYTGVHYVIYILDSTIGGYFTRYFGNAPVDHSRIFQGAGTRKWLRERGEEFYSVTNSAAPGKTILYNQARTIYGRRLKEGTNITITLDADSNLTINSSAGGFSDPMTTAWDIIVRNGSNVTSRLGLGSPGQVLKNVGGSLQYAADEGFTGYINGSTSATSITLGTASHFYSFTGSSPATWTMPAITGNAGKIYWLFNRGTATLTVQRAGSDQMFDETGAVNSFTIPANGWATVLNDAGYWTARKPGSGTGTGEFTVVTEQTSGGTNEQVAITVPDNTAGKIIYDIVGWDAANSRVFIIQKFRTYQKISGTLSAGAETATGQADEITSGAFFSSGVSTASNNFQWDLIAVAATVNWKIVYRFVTVPQ